MSHGAVPSPPLDVEQLPSLALSQPVEALAIARKVLASGPAAREGSLARQAAGIVLRDRGELADSLRELRAALRLARKCDEERVGDVLATYGAALAFAGRTAEGLARLDEALARSPGGMSQARVLLRRAHVLSMSGRHEAALSDLRLVIRTSRRAGDTLWEARGRNNRCLVHLALGSVDRAEADAERAEVLFARVGQRLESVYVHHIRALVAHQRGDVPQALRLMEEVEGRYRELGVLDLPDLAIDHANALLAAGLDVEAVARAEAALQSRHLQPVVRAEILLTSAAAALSAGDAALAREHADEARRLFSAQDRPGWADRAAFLALESRYRSGQRDAALLRSTLSSAQALAGHRSATAPSAFLLSGRLAMELGDTATAVTNLRVAARSRARQTPLERAAGWLATALLARLERRRRGILSACRRGLDAVDEHRETFGDVELRARASGHGAELARLALDAALEVGDARSVLAWSERWRATSLASPPVRPPDDAALERDLAALRDVVRRLESAAAEGLGTSQLERERGRHEAAVRRHFMRLHGQRGGGARLDFEALFAALAGARLVSLIDVEGRLHALVVDGRRVRRREVGPTDAAAREIEYARFALRRSAHGRSVDTAQLGRRLEHALLGPAARLLAAERVVLVPAADLHTAPWGLLPVFDETVLSVCPSASLWLKARSAPRPSLSRVVLVAGPRLAHAESEVHSLHARHPGATVLTGPAASVGGTLAALDGAGLAHVAAHGDYRSDAPLFSSLALADGPLTVHDLDRLGRPPRQVVLSACDTGAGAHVGTDEVLGLVTSLLALGTTGVLASSVAVNDAASVRVMEALHDALRRGVGLPEGWLAARRSARGEALLEATAGSFTAWGA